METALMIKFKKWYA